VSEKPKPPKGLLPSTGAALWRDVVALYDLRVDELVVLERACRATDRIAAMETERGKRVTTAGSMGQLVLHPLVKEIRETEAQIARLLASLKLPDDGAGAGAGERPRSTQARAAAQSRWASAHGASA
jgi:hypothetical protein